MPKPAAAAPISPQGVFASAVICALGVSEGIADGDTDTGSPQVAAEASAGVDKTSVSVMGGVFSHFGA